MSRTIYAFLALWLFAAQGYGATESVSVEADGSGATVNQAIDVALRNAIAQVNGAAVAAQVATTTHEESGNQGYSQNETFQGRMELSTKGLVKSYEVINKQQRSDLGNVWEVTIRALIVKYVASPQSSRKRIAVLPLRYGVGVEKSAESEQFNSLATAAVVDYLTQTRKFAVVDRDFGKDIGEELKSLKAGDVPIEEMAKLGNRMSADLLVVGTLETASQTTTQTKLRLSGKEITNKLAETWIAFRVIDVATRQVKLADRYFGVQRVVGRAPDAKNIANDAGHSIGASIVNAIYPIAVEAIDGDILFLGQGGGSIATGERYRLIELGKNVRDTHTGEQLGRAEKDIGQIEITDVQPKMAKAKITTGGENIAKEFAQGKYIVRPETKKTNARSADAVERDLDKEFSDTEKKLENAW